MPQLFARYRSVELTFVLLVLSSTGTKAVVFDVYLPAELEHIDGNDASRLPFSYLGPVRYQQVYHASAFSLVPSGGAFLTRIFFRADCSSRRSWLVTNLQVNLSTTARAPDNLSSTFAANIGPDETVVFQPAPYIPPGVGGPCPNAGGLGGN